MPCSLLRLFAAVFAVALLATACGGGDGDGAGADTPSAGDGASDDGAGVDVGSAGDAGAPSDGASGVDSGGAPDGGAGDLAGFNGGKPAVDVPDGPPPTELEVIDLIEGDGPEVVEGSTVEVHYVGISWSTGEQFDSSWDSGRTYEVTLGGGGVIAGWEQGLLGMQEGGRRELHIPPSLAYGSEGIPGPSGGDPVISPDETLIFVVDVVEAVPPPDPSTEPDIDYPDDVPDDLVITDIEEGDGPTAAPGDRVVINFVLGVMASGEKVASTWDVGSPFVFDLGGEQVETIPALDLGVVGMKVGGMREIVAPPGFGFSEQTAEVSPDDTLVFVVELVEVRR